MNCFIRLSSLNKPINSISVNDVIEYIRKVKLNQPKFLSNIPKVCGDGTDKMAGIKDFRRILFKLTQVSTSCYVLHNINLPS